MLASLCAIAALGTSSGAFFPSSILTSEFERGRAIALRRSADDWQRRTNIGPLSGELQTITDILEQDRKAIGTWNQGLRKVDVEFVVRFSPELISRWFGFLSAREGWQKGQEVRLWQEVREQISDRPTFLVVLSTFPSQQMFGSGEEIKNPTDEMLDVVIQFESEVGITPADVDLLKTRRAKGRGELDAVRWWEFSPLAEQLRFAFDRPQEDPIIQRGDFHRAWYWVTTNEALGDGPVTLKVLSRRKIRSATFPVSKTGI